MENKNINSFSLFECDHPSRYLMALCNHFGRNVEAQCDANRGWVEFPFGRCDMTADESQLEFGASAEDEQRLSQVEKIMTSHLERFAFRENPRLTWKASINNR